MPVVAASAIASRSSKRRRELGVKGIARPLAQRADADREVETLGEEIDGPVVEAQIELELRVLADRDSASPPAP